MDGWRMASKALARPARSSRAGAVAYFDGVINHRGRHSTGRTTGAQERLVLVIRAAVNTNYADADKSFKAQGGA